MTSDRRVFPLVVEAPASSSSSSSSSSPSPSPVASGARLLPPPPKSPLYSVRRHHVAGSKRQPSGDAGDGATLSGFERMLLLRQMNVTGAGSSASSPAKEAPASATPATGIPASHVDEPEVSAAQNLKQRRQAEQQRRQEMALMRREDYLDTPEGAERLRRQEERGLMLEEELVMRRLLEAEVRERRRQQLIREQQEEARVREQYLAKLRQQREQQEREAREKELARKQALEARMKALKEEADTQAREETAARQRQMEHDALIDRERRVSSMETALMQLEDALAGAVRQQWLVEVERQRQIEAERDQWRLFQEQEQAKLREATMQRRAAMAQQYEQDKRRKMEIHRLQKEQAAVVGASIQSLQSVKPEASPELTLLVREGGGITDPPGVDSQATPTTTNSPTGPATPTDADASSEDSKEDASVASNSPISHSSQAPDGPVNVEPPWESTTADAERDAGAPSSAGERETAGSLAEASRALSATWTVELAQANGILPFAQVQSVKDCSPAMEATLRAGDLIVNFGGVTASTPKCLLAVAECVQSHVGRAIAVAVLRPSSPGPVSDYQEHTVSLCPRKWQGKGLLGCQLSPFKWSEAQDPGVDPSSPGAGAGQAESNTRSEASTANSGDGSWRASSTTVVHSVQGDSIACRAGLRDGDLLVGCGGVLDMTSATAGEVWQHIRQSSVSADAASTLHLEVERWLADEQRYCHLSFSLSGSGGSDWGFGVTTYEQYYYGSPSASALSSPVSACSDCYYSTTPSAVHTASLSGHVECIEALVQLLQASSTGAGEEEEASIASYLEWRDDDGRTPLFYACYASQLESTRFLVSRLGSFNVNTGADLYGDTPLHAAVTVGCSPIVRLLLESHYMDANVANAALQTSAHVAPNVEMLRLVESFGADLLATDTEGRMPLAYACLRNDPDSVEFLCTAFPDFADYADERGNTPLHLCAWLGLKDAARVLIRFLPPIALFLTNLDGCSPLELARASDVAPIVDLLERVVDAG